MNRIDKKFADLKESGGKALVCFISAGDPTPEALPEILHALDEAGTDVIELGIPFSDPTADGPTIQRSSARALKAGMTRAKALEAVREFRQKSETPLILFGYYNPVFVYGIERFAAVAADYGADGALIVDLPPEEAAEAAPAFASKTLHLIRLATPTADAGRIKTICDGAGGFLYFVTMTGVTGSGLDIDANLLAGLRQAKEISPLPVVAGFGVSEPEQAKKLSEVCDGVVVGSALVRLIEQGGEVSEIADRVGKLARGLKSALA